MNSNAKVTDITAYRAARRRAGNIRWIMILVFLVACMFAGYFFSLSSFFYITDITVEGNSQVEKARIIELSGVHKGDNIFSVSRNRVAKWIAMEPHIKTALVSRHLPNQLIIQVEERQPVACLIADNYLVEVDATGQVLERYHSWGSLDMPVITGVDLSECGSLPGVTINGHGMADALTIINALPADADDVGEINVANPQFIKLYTVSGIEIRLGDSSDFAHKYLVYTNVIQDNKMERGAPLDYIDVSIVAKPTLTYR